MTAEEIFLAALEQPSPTERAAYLDEACAGNAALRAHIERLLRSHEQAGSFLIQPLFDPAPTVDQPQLAERPGAVIGPYKLLQQIGEGGFGVVFMAEQQQPVRRKVALKIIRPGMDTRQVIARFEAERQALALMDHPNIAKVLDAGTTSEVRGQKSEVRKEEQDNGVLTSDLCPLTSSSGRPYFVMELVKGIPITEYCDEHQLTPRQRLELFLPVCQAVQHAHQKGIIHRDLKPSNVLVAEYDQHLVPKVIDFGVAKAIGQQLTEKTIFTEFGQVVGTIEYMSPEQAKLNQLDIDARTDIYSLGVLLYELLTGVTPFDRQRLRSAAFDEMLRIIREEEPPKPSTRLSSSQSLPSVAACRHTEPKKLTTLMRGELDWIVMKALEKERNRRYETANGLGMDIQRYLNDEHVLACPPSAAYRLRKFARRHKVALATAALVAAALVLGTVVSTWQAVRATRAEALARAGLERETQARQEADTQRTFAQLAEREGQRRLYETRLALARASRLSGRLGQRFASLDAIAEAARLVPKLRLGPAEILNLRNEAVAAMSMVDLQIEHRSGSLVQPATVVALDVMCERYARADASGAISIRALQDDREIIRLSDVGNMSEAPALRFSPDGRYLGVRHGTRSKPAVAIWDLGRAWSVPAGNSNLSRAASLPATQAINEPLVATGNRSDPQRLINVESASDVDFSLNGLQAAVAGQDGSVTVYELPSGEVHKRLSVGREPVWLRFSPDGARLAIARSRVPEVEIWDMTSGQSIRQFKHTQQIADLVRSVAWHPNGRVLVVAAGRLIAVWNVETGEQVRVLEGHDGRVVQVAFNRAGNILASAGADGILRLWDFLTYKSLVSTLDSSLNLSGSATIQFGPDSGRLGLTTSDGRLVLYRLATGRVCCTMEGHDGMGPLSLDFSRDGRLLATTGRTDPVRLWDVRTGKQLAAIDSIGNYSVIFDPSGTSLLTCGGSARQPLQRWPLIVSERTDREFGSAGSASGEDGSQREPTTFTVEVGTPQLLFRPENVSDSEGVLAFASLSEDGRTLAVIDESGSRVVVLDLDPGGATMRWSAPQPKPRHLALSPDGHWLAVSQEPNFDVRVWDARTGQPVCELPGQPGQSRARLAFSPDSQWLITALIDEYRFVRVGTWEPGLRLGRNNPGGTLPGFMAFRRDGRLLAVAYSQKLVILMDPANGDEIGRLDAPDLEPVTHLVFSPDGSRLAVGNFKNQIHLWNLRQLRAQLAAMHLDWPD